VVVSLRFDLVAPSLVGVRFASVCCAHGKRPRVVSKPTKRVSERERRVVPNHEQFKLGSKQRSRCGVQALHPSGSSLRKRNEEEDRKNTKPMEGEGFRRRQRCWEATDSSVE